MRTLFKLMAGAAAAATVAAVAMAPVAMADPITSKGKAVVPREKDITGVGSDTIQNLLDQFSLDYNATIRAAAPHLYSWDATNLKTGAVNDLIKEKFGCSKAPRPNGSSAGILAAVGGPLALSANTSTHDKAHFCTDFARASRGRAVGDPAFGKGGIAFDTTAQDGVTWATNPGSPAPNSLTLKQLTEIYSCTVTNWSQVGGKNVKIDVQLPQAGSGTRSFWLKVLGITAPGSCVDSSKGESSTNPPPNGNLPEENEGVNKFLQPSNVIFPFSIGKYLAETEHSATCLNKKCTPVNGVVCKPTKTQNRFGCNTHGAMILHPIFRASPVAGKGANQTINPKFPATFLRFVYVVVRWAKTKDHIPGYLEALFGSHGWMCASKAAHKDMVNYGFLPSPLLCGTTN